MVVSFVENFLTDIEVGDSKRSWRDQDRTEREFAFEIRSCRLAKWEGIARGKAD
jgi:hypothetical protein